jgi:hypothetical protein
LRSGFREDPCCLLARRSLRRALDLVIDAATHAALDRAFPPPRRATRLPML